MLTTYYGCRCIFIETSITFVDAFFKQCIVVDIIFSDMFNGVKGIFFNKCAHIKSRIMK